MALYVLYLGRDYQLSRPGTENSQMLGWMIVFGLMAILAAVMTVAAGPSADIISTKMAAVVFGVLFFACLLTSFARGRA
jgi:hypothetical protein